MAKFSTTRLPFGHTGKPDEDSDEDGIPLPTSIKMKVRRMAGLKEARDILKHIPGPCVSVHAICTHRMDLTDVIAAMIEAQGVVIHARLATLGYHARNLKTMLGWLDSKTVQSLTLLPSLFFRSHNGAMWDETRLELKARGEHHRAACCHSHAKVVTLAFATGERFSIEGSANLCGNGSGREQLALINDAGLHDWHAAWIEELVTRHAGK